VYILLKYYVHHFRGKFLPERSVQTLHVEGVNGTVRVSETAVAQHQRVALLYFATFFIGSFFLALSGMPMEVAMYDFASALGTIGFSKGGTGAHSSDYVLIVQTVGMVFARMEVYMVYTVLFAGLRKMKHSLMRRKKHGRGM
jgi:trk system potassium uptake protein TrkH